MPRFVDNPPSLLSARRISDELARPDLLPIGEVTELPPAEGALQWRLAKALQADNFERAFAITQPMELLP
ncbi:hypothetical protein [Piscinibacter defluvii]|uniref:hypothetical protein n=1 Tax=Piscinibacter defluvii TaxID=1796922 RepID=UPI000FDD07EF|nr:hypothetical protein [Piscinibacter defluvii]